MRPSTAASLAAGVAVGCGVCALLLRWSKASPVIARVLGLYQAPKKRAEETLVTASSDDILSMVFHVAEDQTLRDGVVHRGVTCNNCKASPIKGVRYKCANCADFDLCADCELLEVHNPKHVFIKLKTVVPPQLNPRKPLCGQLYPGEPHAKEQIVWSSLRNLESYFSLSRSTITAYFNEFQLLADETNPAAITQPRFRELLGEHGTQPNLIVDRLYFVCAHQMNQGPYLLGICHHHTLSVSRTKQFNTCSCMPVVD
eukprot:m.39865 g.39865  ORF g.39865 m.39865 type:complete len:257 (-) comp11661_c0_seq4:1128-1898(-)